MHLNIRLAIEIFTEKNLLIKTFYWLNFLPTNFLDFFLKIFENFWTIIRNRSNSWNIYGKIAKIWNKKWEVYDQGVTKL